MCNSSKSSKLAIVERLTTFKAIVEPPSLPLVILLVPATQYLRENRVPDRTLVVIVRHNTLAYRQLLLALIAFALGVTRRLFILHVQTSHAKRTRHQSSHVPAGTTHACLCDVKTNG